MTRQEIFNRVWTFLNTQGKPSYDGSCLYRGPNGTACAVGCLLDDKTAEKFDTFVDPSISNIARYHYDELPRELLFHIDFLNELQEAHDSHVKESDWLENWQNNMLSIAEKHGLVVP